MSSCQSCRCVRLFASFCFTHPLSAARRSWFQKISPLQRNSPVVLVDFETGPYKTSASFRVGCSSPYEGTLAPSGGGPAVGASRDSEVCVRFLNGYLGARLGILIVAITGAGFVLFLHRGERGSGDAHRSGRKGPETVPDEESAERLCGNAGWPKRDLSVPGMVPRLPRVLPGAFPLVGPNLPSEGRGLVSLKKELEAPGLPRVRRADVTMRLARGYAIRALYFRSRLTGFSPDDKKGRDGRTNPRQPGIGMQEHRRAGHTMSGMLGKSHRRRRKRRKRRSAGPFARPMSHDVLFRMYRAAIRASDFYYRDLMSRKYRRGTVVLDRVLYEHAALLLLAGQPTRALEELENLVASMPESRFATYAKAAIVVASARKGDCPRAIRLVAKLQMESLGILGTLAGLAAGRCMLAAKDPARAVGWLVRVVQNLAKESPGPKVHGEDFVGVASHLVLLGACRVLARALSQAAGPESAARRAMKLPQPVSAFVLSELRRIYRKGKRYREEMLLCRLAGSFMAKQSGPAAAKVREWLKERGTLPNLEPVDLGRGRRRHTSRAGMGAGGRGGSASLGHQVGRGRNAGSAARRSRRRDGRSGPKKP